MLEARERNRDKPMPRNIVVSHYTEDQGSQPSDQVWLDGGLEGGSVVYTKLVQH